MTFGALIALFQLIPALDEMENNETLKAQADTLLVAYGLLNPGVFVTGSYFLDVMACPDLDVHIPKETSPHLFALAKSIYENALTEEICVMKGMKLGLPDADHIQIRTHLKSHRAKWKIDLWYFPQRAITAETAEMNQLKNRLTETARDEIIGLKRDLLQANGFSPKYSGFHIYHGYLDEGIRSLTRMKEYLREKGIIFV